MKIGLMHNLYGEFSRGGAETVVRMMAEELLSSGNDIFLITTKPRGAKPAVQTIPNGLKTYYLDSAFYNLSLIPALLRLFWHIGNILSFKKYREIKKILKAEGPELIITHNLMGLGFLTPNAIRSLKIKHEHWLHDIQLLHPSGLMIWRQEKNIDSLGAKIYQAINRAFFSTPSRIVSPSAWLLKMHSDRGFFKSSEKEVKPLKWPTGMAKEKIKNQPAKNFLFIGQVEEQKGIFVLIEAFKKISRPDLTLTIAIRGGGNSLETAKLKAAGDNRIKFLGPLSYEETEKIKTTSDYLIVPSLCYENSPTVIYGAHASGLPVIASDIGGIPEILNSQDKLFKPGDSDDLRKKIEEVI